MFLIIYIRSTTLVTYKDLCTTFFSGADDAQRAYYSIRACYNPTKRATKAPVNTDVLWQRVRLAYSFPSCRSQTASRRLHASGAF